MRNELKSKPLNKILLDTENLEKESGNWWSSLVRYLHPDFIVELGTGDGFSAYHIINALPPYSYFATINWPKPQSGDDPYRYLGQLLPNNHVSVIAGDTREESWRFPTKSIDLLYIDSTHTYECISQEWMLYQPKLEHRAIVIVDDLDHNDMMRFWDELKYEKQTIRDGRVGVFRYTLPDKP